MIPCTNTPPEIRTTPDSWGDAFNRLYDRQCVSQCGVVCPLDKSGDCAKIGVIYQLKCLTCNVIHVGGTGRMTSLLIKEHLAGKRRGNTETPSGRQKNEKDDGIEFEINCTILAHEKEISATKTLETFWISVRNPYMNNQK
ncbi:hypothetical protein RB195_018680 [Necator americanus]|uniref:Kazal-like domain-containing protein n=1 Tax=Necator americanus TaxID=51031 RepID=A0ABR1CD54_NECAM